MKNESVIFIKPLKNGGAFYENLQEHQQNEEALHAMRRRAKNNWVARYQRSVEKHEKEVIESGENNWKP
ncbi:hypothetical protein IV37_GL000159 [Fructilactobacillus fructivorans]|uniref:hypothetical protein n=1 Tax=Fructilactobacillus fructivorans TaxID=1614 RepID=UPI000705190A|nr:hypothetical protein [Fructilactobacillus fructivorans]KRN13438.1 hypothetical protein IV37_GL000159 [Fructilactobacillus fructivorans]